MKRLSSVFVAVAFCFAMAPASQAQYTTDWVANTFGTDSTHVGNTARSMWVAPDGTIYTASLWDEVYGGISIYQNGKTVGSIGLHNDFQGSCITGNSTSLFAALQFSRNFGSGYVGRYNRATGAQDFRIQVSAATNVARGDVITGCATANSLFVASDNPGNRVRMYTTDGVWKQDISVQDPGALAIDSAGNIWVAQKSEGRIAEFSPTGAPMNTIQMPTGAQPSALFFDLASSRLMAGDEGPDMDIKLYAAVAGRPTQVGTFGVQGGFLNTTTGAKGQVSQTRFTRVVGIGRDAAGNLAVLDNPWGGSWDLGRNGATSIHVYDRAGNLTTTLQSLNFEGNGAPDPLTDGALFFGGTNVYGGTAGGAAGGSTPGSTPGSSAGTLVANTVDPIAYPNDPRLNVNNPERDTHFAQIAAVGPNRILAASGQNPSTFYLYHFSPQSGYIAIPDATLPGAAFATTRPVTGGFSLDSQGGVWAGLDRTNQIFHYPLTGVDATGKPTWGAPMTTLVPVSIRPLTRIVYLPESDTMILGQGVTGSADFTSMGNRIEVYHGWTAGNDTTPNPVITFPSGVEPKSIAAAGNYLFVGYITSPNIDAFNLTTGSLDMTLANTNPTQVSLGANVDSMYGVRAYLRSTGEYVVTKDNYNDSNLVVYRWTPGTAATASAPAQ
ncbi:SMP-30/gluconolactonase/LRE family protein [Paraburkholderia sp. SOS3]|uniref:SMP-30/gluconolactonase/LRE family protein n=1 Tax=Paraburkholderia sp. SOS3 TaxID=1926494 RepID=UPI0009473E40|nr:SMP-30/gluconolactonase/LRE family protein [Paraburkholderia sp. SOS3]APR39243.1 SMP-30/gluconolaconase/LRE-like region family protein [Paraburkholderia sp. SOS3]